MFYWYDNIIIEERVKIVETGSKSKANSTPLLVVRFLYSLFTAHSYND